MLFSAAEGKIGSSTTAILSQFLISNLKVVYAHTSGDVDSFKTNLLCILSLSLHAKFD